MENDSLFGDDTEPPGPSVEIVSSASEAASIFLDSPAEALPVVSKVKPQRQYFPFKDSLRAKLFRQKHYPDISRLEWFDWRWQFQNAIRDVETLGSIIRLSDNERQAMIQPSYGLPVAITPYYASLLSVDNEARLCAGRLCLLSMSACTQKAKRRTPSAKTRTRPCPAWCTVTRIASFF